MQALDAAGSSLQPITDSLQVHERRSESGSSDGRAGTGNSKGNGKGRFPEAGDTNLTLGPVRVTSVGRSDIGGHIQNSELTTRLPSERAMGSKRACDRMMLWKVCMQRGFIVSVLLPR